MKYNFDEIIDRKNTNCEKYDDLIEIFGKEDLIPMWVADTDFRTPDFIVEAIKKRADHEIYGYPMIPDSFYNSIQNWINTKHNWKIEKEWISFSPNVVIGLASTVLSLTRPGDKIIVQPPVYFPFFHVIKGNDRIIVENQLKVVNNHYEFDYDDLINKIDRNTKMLILCSPHNPGGRVWKKEELIKLGKICLEKNIVIVSDEIHSDLIFSGIKHTPIASISDEMANSCITLMSASKTFNIAGLSSSYVIVPNKELRSKFNYFINHNHFSGGNIFGLTATEAAYTHGQEWLQMLIEYLEENLKIVTSFFSEHFPSVKVMVPEGSFLVWIDLSGIGIPIKDAINKLIENGLALSPGHIFGSGGENFVRLNMGCPKSLLIKGLEVFKKTFHQLM
ncbi:MAG: PatB family C-S lyase [Prolixibacteraceae bacterium]|nr:PatB family C-S lyase [Prolixibacteraceae bacterium]